MIWIVRRDWIISTFSLGSVRGVIFNTYSPEAIPLYSQSLITLFAGIYLFLLAVYLFLLA